MANCECLTGYPFFNSKMAQAMSVTAQSMRRRYCQGDNSGCARYMVFRKLGKPKVPPDMIPTQVDRARQRIAGA